MATVVNLSNPSHKQLYTCSPKEAVIAAYAQSKKDWNTWQYQDRYGSMVVEGTLCVACGDFVAFKRRKGILIEIPVAQGFLDSLCAVYALVNADKVVNKSSYEDSQRLFNEIINYLSIKRKLKDVVIGGLGSGDILSLMKNVVKDRFSWQIMGNNFSNIYSWWSYSNEFLQDKNTSIILSFGGKADHLSVVTGMTDKTMYLHDSSYMQTIRRSACRLHGYTRLDKYVIYPTQSFICWRD